LGYLGDKAPYWPYGWQDRHPGQVQMASVRADGGKTMMLEGDTEEVIGRDEVRMEHGAEPLSSEIEMLNGLIEAAKTQRYIDWTAFARKQQS
jgi:hypothetical protein